MDEQEQQNQQDSFLKQQGNKAKDKLKDKLKDDAKKKIMKKIVAIIGTKAAIIFGIVLAATIGVIILLAGFNKIIKGDGEKKTNNAKAQAVTTSYSGNASTTETDEDGNTVSKVVVTTNASKTGYEIAYNNDAEYLEDVREELEGDTVESAEEFTDFELGVLGALMDNGADLDYYSEQELQCFDEFIKAESCTQNLDLRPNSEKIVNGKYVPQKIEDLSENEVPGVILVQRTNTKSNTSTILEYKVKVDFDKLVEENNKDAINYFTINDEGNLVVAKWDHIKITVDGEYPENLDDSEKDMPKEEDIITTEEIPYSQYIAKYKMPFEFLTQLLVITEEPDFCMELVNYVLNSKIVINIQEEETVTVTSETREYTVHSKDNKYINYQVDAVGYQIESDDNYLLKYAKDDEQDEQGKNNCTNYSSEKVTVKVITEHTSHSYVFEIIEVDTWLAHYKKTYADMPVDGPTTLNPNDPGPDESAEYKQIETEVEQPITDQAIINQDNDVKTFIDKKEQNYEPKIVVPSVSLRNEIDDDGNTYKVINVTDGTKVGATRYSEIKDEEGKGTGKYNLPQNITVKTNKVASTNKTKEIPELQYTFKLNESTVLGQTIYRYELQTDIDPLVECTVSSLNTKEFEKIVLDNYIETTVTKYPSDPNPITETHIYARDVNDNLEKFLVAYDNSKGAQNQINSIDSWLFEMMEENEATVELVDVVKYLLYLYDDVDRGVTELEGFEDLFNPDEFVSINSSNGTGWWWPIGSMETTTKDGKLFASGEPALGKESISRMGITGSAYGITVNSHPGNLAIDVGAGGKTNYYNIISIGNGTVTVVKDGVPEGKSNANGGCGNYVKIDYGNGITVRFLHLYAGSIKVAVGDQITYGQVIGKIGHNGDSSGPHMHMDVQLNGVFVDATEYVDPDNPRPESIGGMPTSLYNLLLQFEGGTQYKTPEGYIVFNNGVDNRLEVTCGATFGELPNNVYEGYRNIVGSSVNVGDVITVDQYSQILRCHYESKKSSIDKWTAQQGITLSQAQFDGVFLLAWLRPTSAKNLITAYAKNGATGARNCLDTDASLNKTYYEKRKDVVYNLLVNQTYP